MRVRLEKSIQNSVIGWAKKTLGLRCDKLSTGSRFQNSGLPDFIIWLPGGRPLLIEFKVEGGQPTVLQLATHEQLRELGYLVIVVDDVTKGKIAIVKIIEELKKGRRK